MNDYRIDGPREPEDDTRALKSTNPTVPGGFRVNTPLPAAGPIDKSHPVSPSGVVADFARRVEAVRPGTATSHRTPTLPPAATNGTSGIRPSTRYFFSGSGASIDGAPRSTPPADPASTPPPASQHRGPSSSSRTPSSGQLDVRKGRLRPYLEADPWFNQFDGATATRLRELFLGLLAQAIDADDHRDAVDFNISFGHIRKGESAKTGIDQVVFIQRLADWLNNTDKRFSLPGDRPGVKGGDYIIKGCSTALLSSLAPQVSTIDTKTLQRAVHPLYIALANLKFS